MKNRLQIFTVAISIFVLGFFSYLIYRNKTSAAMDQSIKLNIKASRFIEKDIISRLSSFEDGNIQITDSNDSLMIVSGYGVPEGWQSKTLYKRNIDLIPESFGKFFQGNLPGTDSLITIAWNDNQNNDRLIDYLITSFKDNPPRPWTMIATGDIMLARDVDERMDQKGRTYPFDQIKDLTRNADITIGNLESPFREGNADRAAMVFGAEKASIDGLKLAGFDAINLANNHFGNMGQSGMDLTFNWLKENQIDYFGAGANDAKAHSPLIKTVNGQKIAFLGYTDVDLIPNSYTASPDMSGVAIMNTDNLRQDIAAAKKTSDMIIINMHGGYEYTPFVSDRQISFAHTAIDSGADLVIGHHPHVVEGIEFYKGKFIDYSLGNFIFDQPWSTETQQGLVIKYTFIYDKPVKIELIPIHIYDWSQPQIVTSNEEIQSIFSRIFASSEKLR